MPLSYSNYPQFLLHFIRPHLPHSFCFRRYFHSGRHYLFWCFSLLSFKHFHNISIWAMVVKLQFCPFYCTPYRIICGLGSSVGIATELRRGRFGMESRWGRDFPPVQTGPGAHPASCTMGTGSFRGVKCGRGVLLTTHPLLVSRSWRSRAIPLPTLWPTPGR